MLACVAVGSFSLGALLDQFYYYILAKFFVFILSCRQQSTSLETSLQCTECVKILSGCYDDVTSHHSSTLIKFGLWSLNQKVNQTVVSSVVRNLPCGRCVLVKCLQNGTIFRLIIAQTSV